MISAYGYSDHDRQRLYEEPAKHHGLASTPEERGPFARDRARVLHSAALRRLADKTQVVGPRDGDTPRTRLTHSLEVAQIARGIGSSLGLNADLCEMAGLTHDIGHPPYGHNGEQALNMLATECGGFEGNAQTLRILSRLEPKVLLDSGESVGLNLTRASLDAACKYPRTRTNPDGSTNRKYGCYDEDAELLEWVRAGHEDQQSSMEAQTMDFSDDIAYSVHDVEDGIVSGRIDLAVLWDFVELAALADKGAEAFGGSIDGLIDAAGALRELPVVKRAADFSGTFQGYCDLKALTSQLVGRYISAVVAATRLANDMPVGRCLGTLVVPETVVNEVTLLKTIAVLYVMEDEHHQQRQDRQRDRLFRVYDYLEASGPGALDPLYEYFFERAQTSAQRQRVIIDAIASMTESRLERVAHRSAELRSYFS
ncbi:deoxyguanosinetriphosphate triphosphohydrolase [Corynebacterium sp. ES2794-CONJ1]|uniref:deoxyguanosinetriphosphate triphosphohydrolase n=1 Tax=unclassified Corynebacterium TaxID=2624378 RepID=UPI00216989B0|nr:MULTISPECIES: deoxyguanosinetriphosphate triphosphohydrolase [unclassified Corynebacterium]MCS4490595.1 deoxyguanosinetriphosphate triphosphohydrolase [Corynebacterium sp. ES2775-CONJ]MCU9519829.1 deoxyguanosinetriphosphate triphosphohydrolase [Corynebacterium sp. ES2794-CONJ1]